MAKKNKIDRTITDSVGTTHITESQIIIRDIKNWEIIEDALKMIQTAARTMPAQSPIPPKPKAKADGGHAKDWAQWRLRCLKEGFDPGYASMQKSSGFSISAMRNALRDL